MNYMYIVYMYVHVYMCEVFKGVAYKCFEKSFQCLGKFEVQSIYMYVHVYEKLIVYYMYIHVRMYCRL